MIPKTNFFVHIEKGIPIFLIESILINQYGYSYWNSGDPHQEERFNNKQVSGGLFHFHLYTRCDAKYIAEVDNPRELDKNGYVFDGVEIPCLSAQKLLRKYKINKLKKKILIKT